MNEMIKGRIVRLRNLINNQNELYFKNSSENNISDSLYDKLLEELKKLEEQFPEFKDDNSPTQILGDYLNENSFNKVNHKIPMLSLDKVLSIEQFNDWVKKAFNKLNIKEFIFEYKFDGLANSLVYENGYLTQASTRGNGKVGEDNTATAKLIPNVPYYIEQFKDTEKVEVRGEILLLKEGLTEINKNLPEENQYKNVRNAASGILKNKLPNSDYCKYLIFSPYGYYENDDFYNDTYLKDIKLLKDIFITPYKTLAAVKVNNIDNAIEKLNKLFNEVYENRNNLDIDIDGIVIKANKYDDWNRLGIGKKYPNYAVAYKFPAMENTSVLLDVEWCLGGKGAITPKAVIEPVEIGGSTIGYATLHNIQYIKNLDLKLGDTVIVSKRGDVIPCIESVIKDLRSGEEKEITIPTVCPSCGQPLKSNTTDKGIFLYCDNENCTGMQVNKIENFIKAMEIDNFGTVLINKLFSVGKIKTFIDIYKLKKNDISSLEKMGDKSADKILNNIEKSKDNELSQIIDGLMIKSVSKEKGKILQDRYKTLDNFINCTYEELLSLPTFGEILVNNILEYINKNKDMINDLINLGIIGKVKTNNGKLNNKSFCFTGKLSISRNEMTDIIENNGGTVSSIKKGTDYLIIGEGAKENKIDKAKGYGIEVITEEEFNALL
jgi:DNA ligase (NAD+)